MPDAPDHAVAAAWYADPTGRFQHRYWDGAKWTARVSAGDGTESADPFDPPAARSDAEDPVWGQLRDATATYGRLVEHLQAGRMTEDAFRREAIRVGMVQQEDAVWLLDLSTDRWWRYDGVTLSTVDLEHMATEASAGTATG